MGPWLSVDEYSGFQDRVVNVVEPLVAATYAAGSVLSASTFERTWRYESMQTGLRLPAELNRQSYPTGVTVSDAQLAAVRLEPHAVHGDWNYTIAPHNTPN